MLKFKITAAALLFSCSFLSTADDTNERREAFVKAQLKKGYSRKEVDSFLKPAKKNKVVLDAIQRPWEAKPWYEYYPIFITDKRINAGVKFWKKNKKHITRASKEFNVEPEIIVSIIGVETFFGQHMGDFKVIDALYSLGFYYPPRAKFFSSELGYFMDLIKDGNLTANTKGSYAGAIGYGQFIPSSYISYAVDFNGDGKKNLMNQVDAIGSVANYFTKHRWKKGEPVAYKIKAPIDTKKIDKLLWDRDPPSKTLSEWRRLGVQANTTDKLDPNNKAIIFKLEEKNKDEYWIGLNNFYVITRYNHSQLYAMAVFELSKKIKQAYKKS
jgi:membrane-bound lytic murein transglycosylase B